MGKRKLCAYCLLDDALHSHASAPAKHNKFWSNRIQVLRDVIVTAKRTQSLNACSDDHAALLVNIRATNVEMLWSIYRQCLNKLNFAIARQGRLMNYYNKLITSQYPDQNEITRVKAEIIHQNQIVGQRRRRVSETNPQPVKKQDLTDYTKPLIVTEGELFS
jgi:hypothetical protein